MGELPELDTSDLNWWQKVVAMVLAAFGLSVILAALAAIDRQMRALDQAELLAQLERTQEQTLEQRRIDKKRRVWACESVWCTGSRSPRP